MAAARSWNWLPVVFSYAQLSERLSRPFGGGIFSVVIPFLRRRDVFCGYPTPSEAGLFTDGTFWWQDFN